jgi:hypothetical protein
MREDKEGAPTDQNPAVIVATPKSAAVYLPIRTVLSNARKAFDEERLSIQHHGGRCLYRTSAGLPCVIGASLDDNTAAAFDNKIEPAIDELVKNGWVDTDDVDGLAALQRAHDSQDIGRLVAVMAELEAKYLTPDGGAAVHTEAVDDGPGMNHKEQSS